MNQEIPPLGIRWTIGDVSDPGFEALRLSLCSAWNLFGDRAEYAVFVNTIPLARAVHRVGELPLRVKWLPASSDVPQWLTPYVEREMAEGVAWKLTPVRAFPHLHELSLDNDVILWKVPPAMLHWLHSTHPRACLMAADVQSALGQFSAACGYRALNSGIRGLPPSFDMETRLRETLERSGLTLRSELDEQGLQAAVLVESKLFVISTDDVTICSPFPNHQAHLGKCGAHFVGLNPKHAPWIVDGRFAHEVIRERWNHFMPELLDLTGSNRIRPAGARLSTESVRLGG